MTQLDGQINFEEYKGMCGSFMSSACNSYPGDGLTYSDPIEYSTYEMVAPLLDDYFDHLLNMINSQFSKQKAICFMQTCFPLNVRPEGVTPQ